jgi:hypothetical protein
MRNAGRVLFGKPERKKERKKHLEDLSVEYFSVCSS